MKAIKAIVISLFLLTLPTGCWDNNELDEYGFVQALAIDRTKDNQIELTTLFYNPAFKTETGEGPKAGQNGITIRTRGETIFDAVRDITTKFGRKAKWDHMRVLLLGERLTRTQNIMEVLDYFSRDHEPRGTVLPMIAKGTAGHFLDIHPFIEQTIGQQFKKMETSGALYTAKTSNIPFYELAIQLKSPSQTSAIPYIHKINAQKDAEVSGVAFIKNGHLAHVLAEKDTEAFMMLTGRYDTGILEFPCIGNDEEHKQNKETLEVLSLNSKVAAHADLNTVSVDINLHIKGTVGELRCSNLTTEKDLQRFENKINEQVKQQIEHVIAEFQQNKLDAIGISTQIYRKNPKLWKKLEPSWDDRYPQSKFHVVVATEVLSTGMNVGTPFGTKEK